MFGEEWEKVKRNIDGKLKDKTVERKKISYKVDHDSVMEAIKFFNLNKFERQK